MRGTLVSLVLDGVIGGSGFEYPCMGSVISCRNGGSPSAPFMLAGIAIRLSPPSTQSHRIPPPFSNRSALNRIICAACTLVADILLVARA